MAYSNSWRKYAIARTQVPLASSRDPAHTTPENASPDDKATQHFATPSLPQELIGDQYTVPTTTSLVIDTDVDNHDGTSHEVDSGASQSRLYQPVASRDGEYHVEYVSDAPGENESPETLAIRFERGVGATYDPNARTCGRIVRWRDRFIDMHRPNPEYRPAVARYAYTAGQVPVAEGRNQYTSPYPLYAQFGDEGIGTPDQFVTPIVRRAPRPYSDDLTESDNSAGFSLPSWGL